MLLSGVKFCIVPLSGAWIRMQQHTKIFMFNLLPLVLWTACQCIGAKKKKRTQERYMVFQWQYAEEQWMIMQYIVTTYINIISLPDFWMCLFNQTVHKARLNRINYHIRYSSQTCSKYVKCPKSSSPQIFLFLGRSSLDTCLIHHWLEHAATDTLQWAAVKHRL